MDGEGLFKLNNADCFRSFSNDVQYKCATQRMLHLYSSARPIKTKTAILIPCFIEGLTVRRL